MKKTKERLSRNQTRAGLDDGIFQTITREGAKRVGKDTLAVVATINIRKFYARKMLYLATENCKPASGRVECSRPAPSTPAAAR